MYKRQPFECTQPGKINRSYVTRTKSNHAQTIKETKNREAFE